MGRYTHVGVLACGSGRMCTYNSGHKVRGHMEKVTGYTTNWPPGSQGVEFKALMGLTHKTTQTCHKHLWI